MKPWESEVLNNSYASYPPDKSTAGELTLEKLAEVKAIMSKTPLFPRINAYVTDSVTANHIREMVPAGAVANQPTHILLGIPIYIAQTPTETKVMAEGLRQKGLRVRVIEPINPTPSPQRLEVEKCNVEKDSKQ